MEVRARPRNVTVVAFPANDAVLAERVTTLLERRGDRDMDTLDADIESGLRAVHPHVTTSWRDRLAGFGDRVLYVFRDGSAASSFDSDGWVTAHGTARVVTDERGQYLDVNAAAETLFGASRERILESKAGAFTEPDARIEDADALWRALRQTGRLHSLAIVCRPDGSTASVEFITLRDADGPGRNVTYLRVVE